MFLLALSKIHVFVVILELIFCVCVCDPAHSRLMYREVVTVEDAIMAVSVMDCSMQVRLLHPHDMAVPSLKALLRLRTCV